MTRHQDSGGDPPSPAALPFATMSAAPFSARQRLTLLATSFGLFMIYLDATIVNVALPDIQKDFGGGEQGTAVGGRRLQPHHGHVHHVRGDPRRPQGPAAGVHPRHDPVHGRLRHLRAGSEPGHPEHRPRPAGRRRRHGQRRLAGPRERGVPGPEGARRGPSASGRASRRSAWPSARPSAACSPSRSAGGASSSSTSSWAWWPSCWCGPSSRSRPTPPPAASTCRGQLLFIVGVGALTYALIEAPHDGWLSPLIIGLLVAAVVHRRRCSSWSSCAPPTR